MSARTAIHLLLAATLLVSLLPTAAGTVPATADQEDAIADDLGLAGPEDFPVDWMVQDEIHTLYLAPSGNLNYAAPTGTTSTTGTLAGGPSVPMALPASSGLRFDFTETVAEVDLSAFSAELYVSATTSSSVTVQLFATDAAPGETIPASDFLLNLTQQLTGILISLPGPAAQANRIVFSGTVPAAKQAVLLDEDGAGKRIGILVTAATTGATAPVLGTANPITLHYNSATHPSRINLLADSARFLTWTSRPGDLDEQARNFLLTSNAPSGARSMEFVLGYLNAFGGKAVDRAEPAFTIAGPGGDTVFASSGDVADLTPGAAVWGASNLFPNDLADSESIVLKRYALTYPNGADAGRYTFDIQPFDVTLSVTLGQGGSAFELVDASPSKEVLKGEETVFRLSLTNTGVDDVFALQAALGTSGGGWTATVQPAQVSLAQGESAIIELTVDTPDVANNGTTNTVTASATSLLTGETFVLTMLDEDENPVEAELEVVITTVADFQPPILVNGPTLESGVRVLPGRSASVPVILGNAGNAFDRFVVSATGAPAGWTVSLNPGLVELGARSEGVSILRVEAPAGADSLSTPLTLRAARLNDADDFTTVQVPVQVIELDAFRLGVLRADGIDIADSTIDGDDNTIGGTGDAGPVLHRLRDEGPDGTVTTAAPSVWDNDEDKEFDSSSLFRFELTNDGTQSDTYSLIPYVLSSESNTAGVLRSGKTLTDLRFRDLAGCDQATATAGGDGINDGWIFRLFDEATATSPFINSGKPVGFDVLRNDADLLVTVAPGTTKVVYAEMKWVTPSVVASSECATAPHAQTGAGARPADPAPAHYVLLEAVSQNDPTQRASHVLASEIVPSGARTGTQRYTNTSHSVVWLNPSSDLQFIRLDINEDSTTFNVRAINAGNEMDRLRVTMDRYYCEPGTSVASECWLREFVLDKDLLFANDRGTGGPSSCANPVITRPNDPPIRQEVYVICTVGAFDELGVGIRTTAPDGTAFGEEDVIEVDLISEDSKTTTVVEDEIELTARAAGAYVLGVGSVALGTPASVHPGNTTVIPFRVYNNGTNDDNVNIDLQGALPTGYTVTFSVPNPVFIPAGRHVDLLAVIKAPSNAPTTTAQSFTLRATSLDDPRLNPALDTVVVQTIGLAKTTGLGIVGTPKDVFVEPNVAETVSVRVTRPASPAGAAVTVSVDPKSVPPGWSAVLSGQPSFGTGNVATISVDVKAPANVLGTSQAAIRLIAKSDKATPATLTDDLVEFTHIGVGLASADLGVSLTAPNGDLVRIAPGAATKVPLKLQNLGVGVGSIKLSPAALPTGWTAVFDATTVSLQPLQTRTVNVTVTSPANLAFGQTRTVAFAASSLDNVVADSLTLNFTTGRSILGLTVKSVSATRLAPLESLTITAVVNNTGDLTDDVVLRLNGTFKSVLKLAGDAAGFPLATNQSKEVVLRVDFPAGLSPNVNVPVILEAASKGPFLKSVATSTVQTTVLDHRLRDVDGDQQMEYAIDRDLNTANGYEQFRDPSSGNASKAIDPALLLSAAAKTRNTVTTTVNGTSTTAVRFLFDPDGDKKTDLLVDRDGDGKADVFWDPDRGYSHIIPLVKDVTKDGREDLFFDLDGEGGLRLDVAYDPLEGKVIRLLQIDIDNNGVLDYVVDSNGNAQPDSTETVLFGGPDGVIASIRERRNIDGSKTDGKLDVDDDTVIDSNGDGKPDYFVPSGQTTGIPLFLENVDDDDTLEWTFDSNGDGRRDAYFDPDTQTSSFIDAKGDFVEQLKQYWYVGALFGVVLVLFVVLLLVTRK